MAKKSILPKVLFWSTIIIGLFEDGSITLAQSTTTADESPNDNTISEDS